MEKKEAVLHHVVMFPLPLQGPINSTFKLAELLFLSGLNITFVLTENIYCRLIHSTNIEATMMERYSGCFQLKCIPDGFLPSDDSSSGGNKLDVFNTIKSNAEPMFKEMLTSGSLNSETQGNVSCIIADGAWGFACDVGKEIGVPAFLVLVVFWAFFCLPQLIQAGELPFQGDDLDVMIRNVPGTEGFLRRRDLPSCYREPNLEHCSIDMVRMEGIENPKADGLILNSFEELEDSILPHMITICPNIYTLGSLHAHLKKKLAENTTLSSLASSASL